MTTDSRVLAALHDEIMDILEKPHFARAEELTGYCARWAVPERIQEVVDCVRRGTRILRECSGESRRHPLGFDKFVLLADRQYEIRLHVWQAGTVARAEHIHNHRFSFSSSAVTGRIDVSTYDMYGTNDTCDTREVTSSGMPMVRYRETWIDDQRAYVFDVPELVRVRARESWSLTAGSGYFLQADTLHRVSWRGPEPAATLVVKIPADRRHTTVLVPPLTKPPAGAQRDFFTPDDTSVLLGRFLKLLRA
ncbi:hypothetical protein AB0D57_24160 [Streptomyces sp. NPDC048275]|uniref:hypothetical protein n=1 Tax=Streptomyces sp. NPDC048275 TaxID=3155629 RepID=UPI00340CF991